MRTETGVRACDDRGPEGYESFKAGNGQEIHK